MLTKQQFIEWFHINGADIGIPIPNSLIGRLLRKSLTKEQSLFIFISKSFTSHNNDFLILKFDNWDDAFACYSSYGVTFSLKA